MSRPHIFASRSVRRQNAPAIRKHVVAGNSKSATTKYCTNVVIRVIYDTDAFGRSARVADGDMGWATQHGNGAPAFEVVADQWRVKEMGSGTGVHAKEM